MDLTSTVESNIFNAFLLLFYYQIRVFLVNLTAPVLIHYMDGPQ